MNKQHTQITLFQCATCCRVAAAAMFFAVPTDSFAQNSFREIKFTTYKLGLAVSEAADNLRKQQTNIVSKTLVLNTVRQYGNKKALDNYTAQVQDEASAWDKKVSAGTARRLGIVNPYVRTTYEKYYDASGDWQFSVIANDYQAAEKLRDDWMRAYRRSEATLTQLQRDFGALTASAGLGAAQQSELAGMLKSAVERMSQFGAPPLELLPRPVEGDANSPFPSYRAYDSVTGKLIAIGSMGGAEGSQRQRDDRPPPQRDDQTPGPQAGDTTPQVPRMEGTEWKWAENTRPGQAIPWAYIWFDADGKCVLQEGPYPNKGLRDNLRDTWRQEGARVTLGSGLTVMHEFKVTADGTLLDNGGRRYVRVK